MMSQTIDKKAGKLHGLWVIFKKEVIDNLRDRRTLTTLGLSIIISPLFIIGIQWFAEEKVKSETDPVTAKAFELPVIGSKALKVCAFDSG